MRHGLILKRLDRCLANEAWLESYPSVTIIHLPKTYSNHNPLLIRLTNPISGNTNKPFRLEKYWLSHPKFRKVVKQSWDSRNFSDTLNFFQTNIKEWSAQNFWDIFANKKRILARLRGIQNSLSYTTSTFLRNLEQTLFIEYNNTLRLEKDHWKIRSRINWLNKSDANTKFFHISILNRHIGVTVFSFLRITLEIK